MIEPQRHRGTEKTQSHPSIHVANTKTQRHEDITKATHRPIQPTDHTDKHRCPHSRLDHVARSWPPFGGQGPLERAPAPIASDRHWSSFQRPALRERRPRHSCLAIICVYLCDLWANCDGPGFAAERLRRGKRTALRLCVSASLRSFLCVSVSLWFSQCLGGSPGCVGGKFEIRNSKFEI